MEYSYLKEIQFIDRNKISCLFKSGERGVLDLNPYLVMGGLFVKLKNDSYMKNAKLENGVITWGDGELDIAPETVYSKATGKPLPSWMEK